LIDAAFGAPLITTSGGAGEVLSATGDLLGPSGAPTPCAGEGLVPSVALALAFVWLKGDPPDRSMGDAAAGEDGPGAELELAVLSPGLVGG